jgi:predicted unusual protein kinase regulating ubiquinone biosynthesis (AarF/ABC1/UbiB family)
VFYLPGNRIVVIDFGMVGRLSLQRRKQVVDLLTGVARMDEEPMLEVLLDWAGDAYVDEAKLAADVNQLVFDYEGAMLKDIRIGTVIRQFSAIMREHSIVLPADLSLMFKTLITLEGLGASTTRSSTSSTTSCRCCGARCASATSRRSCCGAARRRWPIFSASSAACRGTWRGCCARRGAARRASISI